MIAHVARVALAATVLALALGARSVAIPPPAFACSCVQRGGIADLAGQPGVIIVSGTITDLDAFTQHGTFTVARLYQGLLPSQTLPIRGGAGGDCSMDLRGFVKVVFAARLEVGTLVPGLCSPFGDLSRPEGQTLLAEFDRVFGATGPPEPSNQSIEPVVLIALLGAVGAAAIGMFGLVAFVARRRARTAVKPPS